MRSWGMPEGFSVENRANVQAILDQLHARRKNAAAAERALATFDAGFFLETLRRAGVERAGDGYALLGQALELRGPDPDMEFALALASSWPFRVKEHDRHLAHAREGAQPGTLLARNLASHFSGS